MMSTLKDKEKEFAKFTVEKGYLFYAIVNPAKDRIHGFGSTQRAAIKAAVSKWEKEFPGKIPRRIYSAKNHRM